jgi:hypothetical protein
MRPIRACTIISARDILQNRADRQFLTYIGPCDSREA